jgi:uncharacterized protein YecT (DUF1311 family)
MKNFRFARMYVLCALSLSYGAAVFASPAQSQATEDDAGVRPSYAQCLDKPGVDVPGWFECTAAEFKYQDTRLNKAYKALMVKSSEAEKIALRDSQRTWITDRDALCAIDGDAMNGRSITSNDCVLELTARRAAAIENYVSKNGPASLIPIASVEPKWKGTLQVFATGDSKILAYQVGFINNDIFPDAVLVLDPADKGDNSGKEAPRTVLLLTRDGSGQLRMTSKNDKIVPCAKCGGMKSDDPFMLMRVAKNRFFVATGGGSREVWSDIYVFEYSSSQKDWLLSDVRRSVSDTLTNKQKQIELKSKDFGVIKFSDFNPDILTKVDF